MATPTNEVLAAYKTGGLHSYQALFMMPGKVPKTQVFHTEVKVSRSVIKMCLSVAAVAWVVAWVLIISHSTELGPVVLTGQLILAVVPGILLFAVAGVLRRRNAAVKLRVEASNKNASDIQRLAEDTSKTAKRLTRVERATANNSNKHIEVADNLGVEVSHRKDTQARHRSLLDQHSAALDQLEGHFRTADQHLSGTRSAIDAAMADLSAETARRQAAQARHRKLLDQHTTSVKKFERQLASVEERLNRAEQRHSAVVAGIMKLAAADGVEAAQYVTPSVGSRVLIDALETDDNFAMLLLVRASESAPEDATLTQLRKIVQRLRRMGYLRESAKAMSWVSAKSGKQLDTNREAVLDSEAAMYEGVMPSPADLPDFRPDRNSAVILHMVGKSLPTTQTGYTLRTHYTVMAQKRLGLEPVVAVQAGGDGVAFEHAQTHIVDDIRYVTLGGQARNSIPWDEWLELNIREFAEVVCRERPAIIHVHSDFVNAVIAQIVGERYNIPVVNETRGFWEESWLSRTAKSEKWDDISVVERVAGLPLAYLGRQEREAEFRSRATAVVTLAGVMDEHIHSLADKLELPVNDVRVIPNAVEAKSFPIVSRPLKLASDLQIDEEEVVIGYISSIVEYEGIDTLIKAFALLLAAARKLDQSRDLRPDESEMGGGALDGGATVTPQGLRGTELSAALADTLEEFERGTGLDFGQSSAHALSDELLAHGANPNIRLLIVGDGGEKANLESLVRDLQLEDRVIFTGRVPHEDVLSYYGLIDIFVVPRKPSEVTDLVTPLKPFEAMSTGRACIFSDVRALREIAEEAGSVPTFEAGDSRSLATQLARLSGDSELREQIASESAEWVRNARSWDVNAIKYFELYQDLGLGRELPEFARAFKELTQKGHNPGQLVEILESAEWPSPDGWFVMSPSDQTADEIISDGWRFEGYDPVRLEIGFDWGAPGSKNRSWGFHLHTWEFMDPALQEFDETGSSSWLDWLLDTATDWARFERREAQTDQHEESMTWYDMALSLRMPRLARLLVYAAKSGRQESVIELLPVAIKHCHEILKTKAFNIKNNHGFFAGAACLDWVRVLPGFPYGEKLQESGERRINAMIERQFAPDGGHLEHSPAYHFMLLESFSDAMADGLFEDTDLEAILKRASYAAGWMIQPDGNLVQLGDTDDKVVNSDETSIVDPHTQFIVSDGEQGVADERELAMLPESGFAFVRSPQPTKRGERIDSAYLAFQAGFHSRAHKHADDLSFTWFDRRQSILVDSGRFGYRDLLPKDSPERLKGFYYGAPERQYVESTRAHNTLAPMGEDQERREREPYGSALRRCMQDGKDFLLEGVVKHGTFEHKRVIKLRPHDSLFVEDQILSQSNCEFVSWFNVDGAATLEVDGDTLLFRFPGEDWTLAVSGSGTLVDPVRGGESPLTGWRSRLEGLVEPVWNFGFSKIFSSGTFHTRFHFIDD